MVKYRRDPEMMDADEFDGQAITEWLANRAYSPHLPFSAHNAEFKWAHENPSAWEFASLPEGLSAAQAKVIMQSRLGFNERANPNHDSKGRFATKGAGGGAAAIANRKDGETISGREANDLAKRTADEGGFTYDVNSAKYKTEGFAVSPYESRSREVKFEDFTGADVHEYAQDNKDLLTQPDHNLGGWHDTDNGTVWLDVSIVKSSEAEAVQVAKEHNQKAIFNLSTFEEIPTGGTGRSLRSLTPHEITRGVDQQGDSCPQCTSNTDPLNVPVHPGCRCDIVTEAVTMGVDPSEIDRMIERFEDTRVTQIGEFEVPEAIQLMPESVTVFAPKDFRFSDLFEWHREQLHSFAEDIAEEAADEAFNVLVLDQGEIEDVDTNIIVSRALRHIVGRGTSTALVLGQALRSKQIPNVIILPVNASPEQLAQAYRIIIEGQ